MSETVQRPGARDDYGRMLPGNRPPGAGYKPDRLDLTGAWQRDAAAYRIVKRACQAEAPEVKDRLKELSTSDNPRVVILAMEAILKYAYGKPTVARLVKAEVLRLTGQEHPYKTIRSWPDGKLKDFDSSASAATLDRGQEPDIKVYQPPLDPQAIAQQQLQLKQAQYDKMRLELLQAEADLISMRNSVQLAGQELDEMCTKMEPALTD